MQLELQALLCFLLISQSIAANVLEDDFGEEDTPSYDTDPMFSARGVNVMRIPASSKSDSRARGDVQKFKQNISHSMNFDDYSDENAGETISTTITTLSSMSVGYSTTLLTSVSTIEDGESWEKTTSISTNTSQQWELPTIAAAANRKKISTKSPSITTRRRRINIRTTTKGYKRPSGMQPLQQLAALKAWMNLHENSTMARYQSEDVPISNLFHSLLQSSKDIGDSSHFS